MYQAFVTAFRTLTIIPIPGKDTDNYASSLAYFPLTGAFLAGILIAAHYLLRWIFAEIHSGTEAFALVTLYTLLTGAMHLDGLADVADATGCRGDIEKKLQVMKDPRIGAFGAIALIFALLGQWIAVTRLIESNLIINLIAAFCLSRLVIVDLAVSNPYARKSGGTGQPFVENATRTHFFYSLILCAFVLIVSNGVPLLIFIPVAWVMSKMLGWIYRKNFGGVTGDILGASLVIVELLFIFLNFL